MPADLKDRVGVLTGGNANLLVNAGDLLAGDGEQCVYLRGAGVADGLVLTKDSTAIEGFSWQAGGGGGGDVTAVTGSDGITVTDSAGPIPNVTNDLVTGVDVAQLNVDSLGSARIDAPTGAGLGISLTAGGTNLSLGVGGVGSTLAILSSSTGAVTLDAATDVNLNANGGDVLIAASDAVSISSVTGDITLASDSGTVTAINLDAGVGGFIASNDSGSRLTIAGAGDIVLSTSAGTLLLIDSFAALTLESGGANEMTFTASRDEVHTIGRNLLVDTVGVAGSRITAANSDLTFEAGTVGGTGEIRLQPGTVSATRTFAIWNGVGDGQRNGAIGPAGGAVIDAESRAAIDTILDYLFDWGWVSNPVP